MKLPSSIVVLAIGISTFIIGFGIANGIPIAGSTCNVALIPMNGTLFASQPFADGAEVAAGWTTSDYVQGALRDAESNELIQGIVLSVDSPGGESVAGDEIAKALANTTKPTVALIRGTGTSAAYWASLGADRIVASRNSYVGSVGAIYSYLDASIKNQKEGLTLNLVQSGELKGIGNEHKPLTAEERAVIERDVKILYENFVDDITAYRNVASGTIELLADGAPMLGEMAHALGLIDAVGGIEEARAFLAEDIGEAAVCYDNQY